MWPAQAVAAEPRAHVVSWWAASHERRFSESLKVASKSQFQFQVWAKNAGQGLSFEEARATSSIQLNSFPLQIDGGTPCRFVALVISLELSPEALPANTLLFTRRGFCSIPSPSHFFSSPLRPP